MTFFLLLGHSPITVGNLNLTQTADADGHRQNATENSQNLFNRRNQFENQTYLFENQRVQSASEVGTSNVNLSSNPSANQQRHLGGSPKKKAKPNISNVNDIQNSTTPLIQSTKTSPELTKRSEQQSPNPEFVGVSTVDDELSNPVPVAELLPLLADQERSIVDELRQLDHKTSALNEQVSSLSYHIL